MIFLFYLGNFWHILEPFGFVVAGLVVLHLVQTFIVKAPREV